MWQQSNQGKLGRRKTPDECATTWIKTTARQHHQRQCSSQTLLVKSNVCGAPAPPAMCRRLLSPTPPGSLPASSPPAPPSPDDKSTHNQQRFHQTIPVLPKAIWVQKCGRRFRKVFRGQVHMSTIQKSRFRLTAAMSSEFSCWTSARRSASVALPSAWLSSRARRPRLST